MYGLLNPQIAGLLGGPQQPQQPQFGLLGPPPSPQAPQPQQPPQFNPQQQPQQPARAGLLGKLPLLEMGLGLLSTPRQSTNPADINPAAGLMRGLQAGNQNRALQIQQAQQAVKAKMDAIRAEGKQQQVDLAVRAAQRKREKEQAAAQATQNFLGIQNPTPADQAEFLAAGGDKNVSALFDSDLVSPGREAQQARIAQAGAASNTLINSPGEKAFHIARGKSASTRLDEFEFNAKNAEAVVRDTETLTELAKGTFTGKGSRFVQFAKVVGEKMGYPVGDDIGRDDALNIVTNRLVLSLASDLKGAMSDGDIKLLQGAAPGSDTTPEGRALILNVYKRTAARARAIARQASAYAKKHSSLDGFESSFGNAGALQSTGVVPDQGSAVWGEF